MQNKSLSVSVPVRSMLKHVANESLASLPASILAFKLIAGEKMYILRTTIIARQAGRPAGQGQGRRRTSGSGAGRGPGRPGQNFIQFWLRMSQGRVGSGTRSRRIRSRSRNPAAFRPIIRSRPTPLTLTSRIITTTIINQSEGVGARMDYGVEGRQIPAAAPPPCTAPDPHLEKILRQD